MAGSSSSQPWIVAVRRLLIEIVLSLLRHGRADPAIHVFPAKLRNTWMPGTRPGMTKAPLPILLQDPLRLGLRILHRLFGRLGAGQRGLEPVVERLGDALVLMGGQLRHRD